MMLLAFTAGCGTLNDWFLRFGTMSIRLVNNGDYAVVVPLYYASDPDVTAGTLTGFGTKWVMRVAPGESVTVTRGCDELRACVVDNAQLLVTGRTPPEADSAVLREGTDYSCGDTIVLTFDHTSTITDFHVTASIER